MSKVFVVSSTVDDYDYSCTSILGVVRLDEFDRFLTLLKSTLNELQLKLFNKSINISKLESDFNKVLNALNPKENTTWDVYMSKYVLTSCKKSLYDCDVDIECFWIKDY